MSKKAAQQLMDQMGAPPEDGYNTIAPRSHRWMMDVGQSEVIRLVGWALWRTIDYDAKGRTGPKKTKRTAAAWDERGFLEIKHAAGDLDMSLANATDALRRAIEKGFLRVTDDGHICVRGDAPLPQRIRTKSEGEEKEKEIINFFCTEKMPSPLIERFQLLDEKRQSEYRRLYLAMPAGYNAFLKQLDAQKRSSHTWDYLQAAEYKERLEADAMAAARAAGNEVIERKMKDAGYEDQERRGRTPKPRTLIAKLTITLAPEVFSVQKKNGDSVQNGNPIPYENENDAVQKNASLLNSSEFSEFSELASSSSQESELKLAVDEALHRSRLKTLGGEELNEWTVSNICLELERLAAHPWEIKKVLDVLEEKCRLLARDLGKAEGKTWGWVVGVVKGEVQKRLGALNGDLRQQIQAVAAGKRIR